MDANKPPPYSAQPPPNFTPATQYYPGAAQPAGYMQQQPPYPVVMQPPPHPVIVQQQRPYPVAMQQTIYTPASGPVPVQQSTVIMQTTNSYMPVADGPMRTTCPNCQAQIITTIEQRPNFTTHLWAAMLCLFGCWPCVCLPYCMDSCQSANHYCPNCNAYIGTFNN